MDEITALREQWEVPEPPADDARTAARAALMRTATGAQAGPAGTIARSRPWHSRRLVFAAAATVTAGVVALGIGSVLLPAGSDDAPPEVDPQPVVAGGPGAGVEILLAAATTALQQPDETGEYWYIKEEIEDSAFEVDGVESPQTLESWIGADGDAWSRNLCCEEVYKIADGVGFSVGGLSLTLADLRQLPTDAEQLTAWVTDSLAGASERPADGSPPVTESEQTGASGERVAMYLSRLLYEVPAPAPVRAAAFQALAELSEVTSLGAMHGGEGLRIAVEPPAADKFPDGEVPDGADGVTLVIDPETATLTHMITYRSSIAILAAQWTDQVPPEVS